jgi:hypothetical protein
MATPSEKLAQSLEVLKGLQDQGMVAIRSADLPRTHRERLLSNGFLQEVMKGWYIPSQPDVAADESTTWYTSYWDFCSAYLDWRFGVDWCLSPEQSLLLLIGDRTVPRQLLVRSPKARNKVTELPYSTSLFDVRSTMPAEVNIEEVEGLRLYSIPSALITCSPGFYTQNPTNARVALSMVSDASTILSILLEGGHSTIAGRLAGAFRNIGRDRIAGDILKTMRAAGYTVREKDPFETEIHPILSIRETSPYVNRIRLMWQQMREEVIKLFPSAPGKPKDPKAYMKLVDEIYVTDAYHSLSIEGYRVSPELIERVRGGAWNPDENEDDRDHQNALAARGYWQAFEEVRKSVCKVVDGENSGTVADEDHSSWYREMFAPCVTAGLLRPADLAGYRNNQVYIRRSMHVPPNYKAVRDAMPSFFDLLREETDPSVRVVLGHFVFVYIHPYMDGNGRIGRFLMNLMLASGGYPWTVVPTEKREEYMAVLEDASVNQTIIPFTKFLARLVKQNL